MLYIKKYSQISAKSVKINGTGVFSFSDSDNYSTFLTGIYRFLQLSYPKFFKMDLLSKTGFLAVEALYKDSIRIVDTPDYSTAVFMTCKSSSLETDENFQFTLANDNIPSPSLFVYTLPNILLGELCIRHKLFSENTCFVSENYLNKNVFDYICQTCLSPDINEAIVLFIDQYENSGEVLALLLAKTHDNISGEICFNMKNVESLIK